MFDSGFAVCSYDGWSSAPRYMTDTVSHSSVQQVIWYCQCRKQRCINDHCGDFIFRQTHASIRSATCQRDGYIQKVRVFRGPGSEYVVGIHHGLDSAQTIWSPRFGLLSKRYGAHVTVGAAPMSVESSGKFLKRSIDSLSTPSFLVNRHGVESYRHDEFKTLEAYEIQWSRLFLISLD